jgi:hypothetical protein
MRCFYWVLRTLDPTHPLYYYVQQELNKHFGKLVSYQSISDWLEKCWDHRGNLLWANLVPLKPRKKEHYFNFVQKLHIYSDHLKFNFIDENTSTTRMCTQQKSDKIPLLELSLTVT